MTTKSILILPAAIGLFLTLGACTGQSEKTGDGGISAPIVAPTGQTDTSAPKTDVPTPATPRPGEPSGATNNNAANGPGKSTTIGTTPTPVGVNH